MLERDGEESARATSILRFSSGASFITHAHDLSLEVFVLEGIFSDESGDYGPGSYIKNASGSMHAPRSAEGCTLFVKLGHLNVRDRQSVVWIHSKRTGIRGWYPALPLCRYSVLKPKILLWCAGRLKLISARIGTMVVRKYW
jgi:hypothetical protein